MSITIRSTSTDDALGEDPARPGARLVGLATAAPDLTRTQHDVAESLASLWRLDGADLERWWRIIRGSQIDTRSGVAPIETLIGLSTSERMRIYEREAPPLAERAARAALSSSGVEPSRITDLIVASCTGFSAPGVDVELVDRLGLAPSVRRTTVGFMGCFGAITALRAASGACSMNHAGACLVVCVELCSLHLRPEPSVQNQVASALFADGAAAAVLAQGPRGAAQPNAAQPGGPLRLMSPGASRLGGPEERGVMTWSITDQGFAMTLSPRTPEAIRRDIGPFLDAMGDPPPRTIALHPGGAAILDAAADALRQRDIAGMDESRSVMRRHGNMSSPSVLFVLENILHAAPERPITLLAFGPGLTIESLTLH